MTVTDKQNMLMVRRAIKRDPHTSIKELSTRGYLSRGTIKRIIHEYLHKKKICALWIPHLHQENCHGRNSGGVLLLIRKSLSNLVKEVNLNFGNTVCVRIDQSVFNSDKDVLLIARYVVPENGPLYDTLELKDGILILEEGILQAVQNEDLYVLICGDLKARTGCEQPKQESMLN